MSKFKSEIISLYKSDDWNKMRLHLRRKVADMSGQVLISAVIDARHPEEEFKRCYGLKRWDKKLQNKIVLEGESLRTSNVDFFDFFHAYEIAARDMKDEKVAKKIKDYVRSHHSELAKVLLDPVVLKLVGSNHQELCNFLNGMTNAILSAEKQKIIRGDFKIQFNRFYRWTIDKVKSVYQYIVNMFGFDSNSSTAKNPESRGITRLQNKAPAGIEKAPAAITPLRTAKTRKKQAQKRAEVITTPRRSPRFTALAS